MLVAALLIAITLTPVAVVPWFTDPTGIIKATLVRASGAFVVLWLLFTYLLRDQSRKEDIPEALARRHCPAYMPVLLVLSLILVMIVSTAFSTDILVSFFGRHLGYMGLWTMIGLFGLFLGSCYVTFAGNDISKWIVAAAMAVSILAVLQGLGVYTFVLDIGPRFSGRAYASMGNPDFLGMYLAAALGPALGLIQSALTSRRPVGGTTVKDTVSPAWRIISFVSVAALLAGIVLSGSRGAMLAAVAVFASFVLIGFATRRIYAAQDPAAWASIVGVAAGGAVALMMLASTLFFTFASQVPGTDGRPVASGDSAALRILAWRGTMTLIDQHPLLGVGPEALSQHLPAAMPLAPGAHHRLVPEDSHNLLLTTAASSGLPALMLLLLFYSALCRAALLARGDPMVAGAVAGVTGYMVAALFNPEDPGAAAAAWILAGIAVGGAADIGGRVTRLHRYTARPVITQSSPASPPWSPTTPWSRPLAIAGLAVMLPMLALMPIPLAAESAYSNAQTSTDYRDALANLRLASDLAPYDEWYKSRLIEAELQVAMRIDPSFAGPAAVDALTGIRRWTGSSHMHLLAADALDKASLLGVTIPGVEPYRALELAERAVELRPDSPDALSSLARMAKRRGFTEKSAKAARGFLELGMTDARNDEMRGVASRDE